MQPPTPVHLGNIMSFSDRNFNTVEWRGQQMREGNTSGARECVSCLLCSGWEWIAALFSAQFIPATGVFFLYGPLSFTSFLPLLSWPETHALKWRIHTARHFQRGYVCERDTQKESLWSAGLSLWLQRPWPSQRCGLAHFSHHCTHTLAHIQTHTHTVCLSLCLMPLSPPLTCPHKCSFCFTYSRLSLLPSCHPGSSSHLGLMCAPCPRIHLKLVCSEHCTSTVPNSPSLS